jgi:hypothetical protein
VADELSRAVDTGEIEEALIAALGKSYELVDSELDERTMEEAHASLEEVAPGA